MGTASSPVSAGFGNSRRPTCALQTGGNTYYELQNRNLDRYIYIFTPHTIEKIYERYMHASILLQHLATAPLDTRQLHELVLCKFSILDNTSQPHPVTFSRLASIYAQHLATALLDTRRHPHPRPHSLTLRHAPQGGGAPPPPHRLKPLLNPKTSHKFTRPPNKRKNEKKTQQLKLEELREL